MAGLDNRGKMQSSVPVTRLGRFARLGFATSELLVSGVAQGVKQMTRAKGAAPAAALLSAGNAQRLARRLAGMRGAAMKMGQMLSMEGADLLPPEFVEALSILRSAAHAMPDAQLRRVMGREFGKGWEGKFREFDKRPVAAASIGQVHRVVAADGRELALKVQYPGVSRSIESDIDNLAALLRVSRLVAPGLDLSEPMLEIKRQLRREANYRLEAEHLGVYRRLLRKDGRFEVPRVHGDLSTARVMAMDYMEGVPIESLADDGTAQVIRDAIAGDLLDLLFREVFEFRVMQSDPNFANYLYQSDERRIVLLDFGATLRLGQHFPDNFGSLVTAFMDGDTDACRVAAAGLGYLGDDIPEEYARGILSIMGLLYEPFSTCGSYDFAQARLFSRARDLGPNLGLKMIARIGKDYTLPPPEVSFLHRKLLGTLLICARLRARVDVPNLVRPYLQGRATVRRSD